MRCFKVITCAQVSFSRRIGAGMRKGCLRADGCEGDVVRWSLCPYVALETELLNT